MNRDFLLRALAGAALAAALTAHAGPGAHGPNGEHLDSPTTTTAATGSRPRIEARTEQFELVGTLGGGEFSLLIDRFATNEPVLKAQVEVESGGLKAKALFHDDIGDYAVADEALLKLLGQPGDHPLVITVIHGNETDLLDATLRVTAAQAAAETAHGHDHGDAGDQGHEHLSGSRKLWLGVATVVAVGLLVAALRRRRGFKMDAGGPA
jgi:hypothetical protein